MKNNNNKRQDKEISILRKCVYDHVAMSNEELGTVKINVAEVRTDVRWIKDRLGKQDKALIGIILGVVGAILTNFLK